MLKHRVLTALVLIPVFLAAVLWPDAIALAILMTVVVTLAAYEWARMRNPSRAFALGYSALTVVFIALIYLADATLIYLSLMSVATVFWCVAFVIVIGYQNGKKILPDSAWVNLVLGQLLMLSTWASLYYLKAFISTDGHIILLLMFIIWAADSCAYFIGRQWGKHRLASRVSPGKTWEGTLAGLLGGLGVGVIYVIVSAQGSVYFLSIMLVTFLATILSVIGDLFESIIKRDANVKDSGQLLPGHGGVLDRIDSLVAAGPAFVLAMVLLGITT